MTEIMDATGISVKGLSKQFDKILGEFLYI